MQVEEQVDSSYRQAWQAKLAAKEDSKGSAVAAQEIALPHPVGYHLMVEMFEAKAKIGSIHVPENTKKLEDTASCVAQVVAMGPDAYQDKARFTAPWCKVGDYIIMRPYSGSRVKVGDKEFRFINDDTVEAVVPNPAQISRAY